MKKLNVLFPVILILVTFIIQSNIWVETPYQIQEDVDIPENVKSVLDNKCFGCHNTDSRADKAKEKLLLDKLGDLSKAKMIATLEKINEMAGEGKMPPEKFLEQRPEKKLSEEEQKLLVMWTEEASNSLLK